MPVADTERLIRNPPLSVAAANHDAMTAGNPVADWVTSECVPEPGAFVFVGDKQERRDKDDGRIYYEDADSKLYPNYLTWCKANGRESLGLRRFRGVVVDMVQTLGHRLLDARRAGGRVIQGLRLRRDDEQHFPWLGTPAQTASAGLSAGCSAESSTECCIDAGSVLVQVIDSVGSVASAGCFGQIDTEKKKLAGAMPSACVYPPTIVHTPPQPPTKPAGRTGGGYAL